MHFDYQNRCKPCFAHHAGLQTVCEKGCLIWDALSCRVVLRSRQEIALRAADMKFCLENQAKMSGSTSRAAGLVSIS